MTATGTTVDRQVVERALGGERPVDPVVADLLAPLADPVQLVTVQRHGPDGLASHHVVVGTAGAVALLGRPDGDELVALPFAPALVPAVVLAVARPGERPDLDPDGPPLATSVRVSTQVGHLEVDVVALDWLDAGLDDAVALVVDEGGDELPSATLAWPWLTRDELCALVLDALSREGAAGSVPGEAVRA